MAANKEVKARIIMVRTGVSDVETPASGMTSVEISFKPQSSGSWTTRTASYSSSGHWYIDETLSISADLGLYDVRVDVTDPDAGVGTKTDTGEFTVIVL